MTGIVVTGHGHFATGLLSSLAMLSGVPEYCKAVDFLSDMTQEDVEEQILRIVTENNWAQGVLLTDIVGGTPFKAAVKLAIERPELRVLTGTNLSVLLQLSMDAGQDEDIDESIQQAVEDSRLCLKAMDLDKFRG